MISLGRHPKSAVAAILAAAKKVGLVVVEDHNGHRWGRVTCNLCKESRAVWSTPRNPDVHARLLARFVAGHQHLRAIPPTDASSKEDT